MKKTLTLSLASLALTSLLSFGASAETYEGVLTTASQTSRAAVRAEAVATAHANNESLYNQGYSRGTTPFKGSLDQTTAYNSARTASRAHNQNLDSKAFYNSRVPDQYKW